MLIRSAHSQRSSDAVTLFTSQVFFHLNDWFFLCFPICTCGVTCWTFILRECFLWDNLLSCLTGMSRVISVGFRRAYSWPGEVLCCRFENWTKQHRSPADYASIMLLWNVPLTLPKMKLYVIPCYLVYIFWQLARALLDALKTYNYFEWLNSHRSFSPVHLRGLEHDFRDATFYACGM